MKNIFDALRGMVSPRVDINKQLSKARLARAGAYAVLAGMAIYALCFIAPPVHDNDSHAITGTSIASDTTLSISLSGSVLPLDITPTSSAGTFASTVSGDTHATIRVATNNITGYTIGIKASNPNSSTADKLISNNEQCENTPTSAKCAINSLPQPVTEAQYIDNTMEGVDLNNTWGYLPSKYNSEDNINYLPAPVSGDTIATTSGPNPEDTTTTNVKSGNDNELVEDEYTIDYGMRIDYSPYAGTYSTNYNNQSYIITAVGNPVPYSVSYDANKPTPAPATSTVDNVPSAQTGTVSSGTTVAVILSSKVPTIGTKDPSTEDYTYAGYVFNGWCTVEPQEDQTTGYQTCNDADIYQPGDDFGIDQTADNTTTLYAVWGAPATVTFNANGLIYDNTATETTNTVDYIPTYADGKVTSDKTNTIYTGTYKTPAHIETTPATNYIFKGWSTDPNATEATYVNEQAIIDNLSLNADDNITLYAVWAYTTVITFDKNGADGTEIMAPQTIEANTTAPLEQNTYTNTGLILGSWNTAADGTGDSYAPQGDYQAQAGSNNVTLYAQWIVPPRYLYNEVKNLVKKSGDTELTQTATDLKAVITEPTSSDPSVDTSNSGVYKYDANVFGVASDASNSYPIYYYRGILDSNLDDTGSTFGSNGDGAYYPNYVRLDDTCWRIVRTTGSGGVKMIYNGSYSSGTKVNSCANDRDNAWATTSVFNGDKDTYQQIVRVGYTYNSTYASNTAQTAAIADVFGSDTTPAVNNTDSIIKDYIEDEWFISAIGRYESKLEPSAGYCNDRTVYDTISPYTQQTESTSIVTYGTRKMIMLYFGAYVRNENDSGARTLTLSCARDIVDLYTTNVAANGNKQLSHPVALLTADETALAGSGGNGRTYDATFSSNYSYRSYLRSGRAFWLLSPYVRDYFGDADESYLSDGNLTGNRVNDTNGVRPVISLKHEVTVAGGSGTATDPWTIDE